ncbi:MAG: NAD-dependent epimerase/dehydratase family protein [Spirochaetales bacterium]|nr:NAD-dependent epimerase/dehydratase family protein [Spirochaetales bacterium]
MNPRNRKKILVTGGSGFIGSAIVELLVKKGYEVINYSLEPPLVKNKALFIRGDVNDYSPLLYHTRECGGVIHTAAKVDLWGRYNEFYNTNVLGTESVIRVCRENRIPWLVYTSSPSVTFDGSSQKGVKEVDLSYPGKFPGFYPATKALGEKAVLNANSKALRTLALRPHLVWGGGRCRLMENLYKRAAEGSFRFIGNGDNLVDTTYIYNAAWAHWKALEALEEGRIPGGRAYFISQGEPLPVRIIINALLAAGGFEKISRTIHPFLALGLAYLMETAAKITHQPPLLTRFFVKEMSESHWFDISRAREELGYEPQISIDEGLKILAATHHSNSQT